MKYQPLTREIRELEERLRLARIQLSRVPGVQFIEAVENHLAFYPLDPADPAHLLVAELNQRDEPMDRASIVAVFEASGYEYTARHIDACRPDSAETIREQIAYYAE